MSIKVSVEGEKQKKMDIEGYAALVLVQMDKDHDTATGFFGDFEMHDFISLLAGHFAFLYDEFGREDVDKMIEVAQEAARIKVALMNHEKKEL